MPPQFRQDLEATKEEQQGVAFFRIDDPATQASFRLYEIEYMIACKLDGVRALGDVIAAVKSEFNFDISVPDLNKFIGQLETMGFIHGVAGGPAPGSAADVVELEGPATVEEVEEITAVFDPDSEPDGLPPLPGDLPLRRDTDFGNGGEANSTEVAMRKPQNLTENPLVEGEYGDTVPTDGDMERRSTGRLDVSDVRRMLVSALEHLRSGYIVHSRDYFVAAQAADPGDSGLSRLIARLEAIDEPPTFAGLTAVWQMASEIYPDLVAEVGEELSPDVELADGGDNDDLRTRMMWTAVLLLVLGVGGGALFWVMKSGRLFEGAAKVRVAQIHPDRIAIYFDEPATEIAASKEQWVKSAAGGAIGTVKAVGTQVEKGEIIATLALEGKAKKKMAKVRKAVAKATKAYEKAKAKVAKLNADREQVLAQRDEVQALLKELKPQSVLKGGGVSKKELDKNKRALVKANKKLSKLTKKAKKPQKKEKKARKKLDKAMQKLRAMEQKVSRKLIRAPISGTVAEVSWKAGGKASADSKVLLLRDGDFTKVTFTVGGVGNLAVGGTAQVSVARGKATEAKVVDLKSDGDATTLSLDVADPAGTFSEMDAKEFRLVREFADPAFTVEPNAVFESDESGEGQSSTKSVFLILQGRLKEWPVDVVATQPHQVIIRSLVGTLRDGDQVVVENLGEGVVADLNDGMSAAE